MPRLRSIAFFCVVLAATALAITVRGRLMAPDSEVRHSVTVTAAIAHDVSQPLDGSTASSLSGHDQTADTDGDAPDPVDGSHPALRAEPNDREREEVAAAPTTMSVPAGSAEVEQTTF